MCIRDRTNFSEKFSGLFHEAVPDQQIAENVGEYLFGSDRTGAIIYNGIEGETREYNGTDYTYTGLSDVTVTEGEDETVYLSLIHIWGSKKEVH